MSSAIRQLDSLLRAGCLAGLSDAELLDRVLAKDRGIASVAFEALIRRHGPMVLATCRGVLRNEHDAEDAFQATFLILLRRAGSLRSWDSLGPWLHRVAVRSSERARAQAVSRRERETRWVELAAMEQRPEGRDSAREEIGSLIHQEVNRLPERYRVVLVLCDLQSESYEAAAARLRVPIGTVRSRLSRARQRLRGEIVRRGIALPAGAIATALAEGEASAAIPARLIAETMRVAKLSAASGFTAGSTSSAVSAYANKFLSSSGLIVLGKGGVAFAIIGVGIVLAASGSGSLPSTARHPAPPPENFAASAIRDGGQELIQPRGRQESHPDRSRADLLAFLEEARQSANALKDAQSRARMLLAIATAQAKVGDQLAAHATLAQAVQAAAAIENLLNRVFTLEDIAVAQIDSRDREAALATMRDAFKVSEAIDNQYLRNTARMWIVRTFSRAGDLDSALRITRELPESNMFRSRALANALGGLKKSDGPPIKQFLPTFLAMAEAAGDRTRWAECMQGIAQVLANCGEIDATLKIANDLEMAVKEFGLQDDRGQFILHAQVLVLSALAEAHAKAGKREAAVTIFNKATALAGIMPGEGEALRSDRLGGIVRARVDAGDIKGAVQTCQLIVYEYKKAVALIHIAEAQAKAGRRDDARALFVEAIQAAKQIKVRDNLRDRADSFDMNPSECLRTIAHVQARAGFNADAIQTAETITEPSRKNTALAMIATTLAQQGEIKAAVQLADQVDDERAKSSALRGIAEAQAESGDIAGAVKWARSRTSPEARADALLGIVRAIAKR